MLVRLQLVPMKEFTLEDLAKHNGRDPELPMLLSIRGVVYDITSGKQFYGPDGEGQQQHMQQCSPPTSLHDTPLACMKYLNVRRK
jgi:predicted heme/steroid binding protein